MKTITDMKNEIEKILISCDFEKCKDSSYWKNNVKIFIRLTPTIEILHEVNNKLVICTYNFADAERYKTMDLEKEVYEIIKTIDYELHCDSPFSFYYREFKLKNLLELV